MRNLKKFLALVLAMMMTLSLMVTVSASSYKDDDDITDAYDEAVDVLSELGVIQGYGEGDPNEGKFLPKNPITRGEVAAILYRIVTGDTAGANLYLYKHDSKFSDVDADDWFAPYVNFCENNRLIEGMGGNVFAPRANITGYEALTMILRAIGYDNRNEYRAVEWKTWASGWGSRLGLTANIKAGSLGGAATREMVAEIMFKGIQAPMVNYSILNQYTPDLLVDAAKVNEAAGDKIYATDIPNTLLYDTFKIVGKSDTLLFDAFGRPNVMWISDMDGDKVDDGTKYIENLNAVKFSAGDDTEGEDEAKVTLTMNTVAKYDNAVTECQVAKDINSDKKVAWKNIAEVLNGNAEAAFEGTTGTKIGTGNTLTYAAGALHKDADGDMDALHTSDKWIGATGRTTEIYDISDYDVTDKLAGGGNAQEYVIVYVDTYLAEVKSITEAVKDPNDHEIKAATAIVKMGTDEIEVSLSSAKSYKVGQLVLVQTANGAMTGINLLATGEKVPETPTDVDPVATAGAFPAAGTKCTLVDQAETKRVTIKATVGTRDAKMGIITEDGNAIYASNTFLANKTAGNAKSVLPEWWDVDDKAKGITNSMIGRTFDLVLDQNGYIVGMKEVITTESNVGIITGYDQHRVATGKYLTRVEAYMADKSTQTFDVVDMTSDEAKKIGKDQSQTANQFDTSKFGFFKTGGAADTAWDYTSGIYAKDAKLGIGSLVMFKQCTVDGVSAWYFEDASDPTASAPLKDKDSNAVADNLMVGTALSAGVSFNTGDALAIETVLELDATAPTPTMIDHQLDNKSIIFVAEPEYAYNTGKENEGDNTLKYNVYEGFKKAPTIAQASTAQNILFQQLVNHPEYVLVYPQQTNLEYIIKNQGTIIVDDSYLVLSRGATYAGYSEYNVLKNGKADVLQVSNSNTSLNEAIEAAMKAGKLLTVTGRNSAGYVIAADTVENLANATPANSVAVVNCGGVMSAATHPNPLVTGASTVKFSENDGVLNFIDGATTDQGLTLADNCTIQLVNLGTGAVKDITIGVAKVYINKEGNTQAECDFTFELDQYGYVCSLYVIEK